jgi:hypothetical protein
MALAGAGIFLGTWDETGWFFDLLRNDGLLIGLLTWSMVSVRAGWLRAGGLLLVAAFATKHSVALLGLPMLLWLWRVRSWTPALRFATWSVLPAVALTVALSLEGDGLFLTYLLGVPSAHGFVAARFFPGAAQELWGALPAATLLLGAGLALHPGKRSAGGAYWAVVGACTLLLSMAMRGHHGGFLNVLIPATWVLALGGVLAASALSRSWPRLGTAVVVGVLGWQLWDGCPDPSKELPTEADVAAGEAVIARVAAIEGEVFMPHSPWLPHQAGKLPSLPLIALWDIDHAGGPLRPQVATVREAIAARRWAAIITARKGLSYGLDEHYKVAETLRHPAGALLPKTGWKVRPKKIWTAKD